MNKKGFTLIELLATILLLCLITLIATVSINKVVKDSKTRSHDSQVNNILNAAMTYINDNQNILASDIDNGYTVYLDTLANKGYLEKDIEDTKNNKKIDLTESYVSVTKETDLSAATSLEDYMYSGNHLYVLTIIYE